MTALRAIVLAAGEGRRMGGPKALVEVDGVTLVERHVERLFEVGCCSVLVVARPESSPSTIALLRRHARVHVEAVVTRSQADSLAFALRVLEGARDDVVVITPVDMLPAEASTHHALLRALAGATLAVTPVHCGRGGHPVIARRSVLGAYEADAARFTASPPALRDVLATVGGLRRRVEVDDEKVLGDLDTPSDVYAVRSVRRVGLDARTRGR